MAKQHHRSVRLDGSRLTITQDGTATAYALMDIGSDDGVGFQLEKLDDAGHVVETYHCELYPSSGHHACDCIGALQHGHCKHVAALLGLVKAGRLELARDAS